MGADGEDLAKKSHNGHPKYVLVDGSQACMITKAPLSDGQIGWRRSGRYLDFVLRWQGLADLPPHLRRRQHLEKVESGVPIMNCIRHQIFVSGPAAARSICLFSSQKLGSGSPSHGSCEQRLYSSFCRI